VKKRTEEKIKRLTQGWRDLQKILGVYRKQSDASEALVADLEKLLKSYEKSVFQVVIEG
jgi:hypothetical protein